MIQKSTAGRPGYVTVQFELPSCVWADRIFVTGDFNDWNDTAAPMHQERDGVWRARVEVASGRRYQFRYVIDGRWQTDYHADGFADNEFGSHNSILDLEHFVTAETVGRLNPSVPETNTKYTPRLLGSDETQAAARMPTRTPDLPTRRPRVAAA